MSTQLNSAATETSEAAADKATTTITTASTTTTTDASADAAPSETTPVAVISDQSPRCISAGGTLIPNRVFVGGIPSNAAESDLQEFFSAFGDVRDVKIIADKSGLSKGYGFVTFQSADVADSIIRRDRESRDGLTFRQRRLNIGPAIRKSSMHHRPDSNSNGVFFTAGSVPYTYQNGMAVFHIPGSFYQPYQCQQQPHQHQLALGDLQYPPGYGQPYTMTTAAAAAAAAVAAAAAAAANNNNSNSGNQAPNHVVPATAAQLMCLPAQFATAVWPNSAVANQQQSPSPAQSNTPSNAAYYSAAAFSTLGGGGAGLPYYSSPLAANRTPAAGYFDGATGGQFLSATSDYGTDPSCTDQSYANESVEFDCGQLYSQQQQQQQQMASAYSPAATGYCYGSPPMFYPVRAFPMLLNQPQPQQQQLATPPPPTPVARIVGAADAAGGADEAEMTGGGGAVPLLQIPLQS